MRYVLIVLGFLVGVAAYYWFFGSAISPRPDDAVVRGINYVSVSVSDLDAATAQFADTFDLKQVDERPMDLPPALQTMLGRDSVSASTRTMKSVNAQLRFVQFDSRSAEAQATPQVEVNGPGYAHVCFQVAKKTGAYQKFLESGGVHIGAREMVQLNPARPVEYAYARNADGTMVEIEHVDIEALNLSTPPKSNYRIRHVALATPDYDRAVKFYSVLLEQPKPRRIGRLRNLQGENFDKVSGYKDVQLKMAFFQVRNMELEIAQVINPASQTPTSERPFDALGYNMIVFDVADLDAAREKLIAAGGTVVSEASPMDGGEILLGRDLDQNLLGFQKLSDDSVFSSQNFDGDGT